MFIFSYEKTFIVDSVFNKQTDRVVTFGNEFFEYRRVSTTKYPVSIMMLGVVASNGEKMSPVLFELGYKLTSVVYKKVLEMKVSP